MNLLFWGLTIGVTGKVMLALGVLMAHSEIAHEHRIDARVLRSFKTERWITIIGILLIVLGYTLEIYFYNFTELLTCEGENCTALIGTFISQ